jgi:hypothetical protein
MTIRQFQEWREFFELEPSFEDRADYNAAAIVQTLINMSPYRQKGRPPVTLDDVVVRYGTGAKKDEPTSVEQARAQVLATMGILMQIYN